MEAVVKVHTRKEAMGILKISETTIWRLEKEGVLKSFKYTPKGKVFYLESEIEKVLEKLQSKTVENDQD